MMMTMMIVVFVVVLLRAETGKTMKLRMDLVLKMGLD
jgi:hypothetical protein